MLKTKLLSVFFMIVAITATSVIPSAISAAETKEQAAVDLVKSLGNKAVETLADKSLSTEQKNEKFESYMDEGFDMKLVGRFVLGSSWRTASEAQKKEFQSVFRDYMVATYSEKIGSYSGENLKVNDATSLNDKESLVNSVIVRPNGPPIKLNWRVRKIKSGEEKIVDVIIEGISMAQTQRDEFSSVVNQPGVGIDGLISKLKDRTKSAAN